MIHPTTAAHWKPMWLCKTCFSLRSWERSPSKDTKVSDNNSANLCSSSDEIRWFQFRWQHLVTEKKNTEPFYCAPVYMWLVIARCVRHITTQFRRIRRENLQRRSAFILFIFPRNSHKKEKKNTQTVSVPEVGEKHTEEASESHSAFQRAHARRSIPSAPTPRAFDPAALLDGSPDVSFGFGFSAGEETWTSKRGRLEEEDRGRRKKKKNSNPGCLEREDRLLIRGLSIHGVLYAQSGLWGLVLKAEMQGGERGWGIEGGEAMGQRRDGGLGAGLWGREEKRLALDEMSSIVIKQEFPLSL